MSVLWNFYGDARKTGSAWRTVAPGFGFTMTLLDFDEDDDMDGMGDMDDMDGMLAMSSDDGGDGNDLEIGLGLTASFFDNLLSVTYGWNLMAEQNGSRNYWAIGVSLSEALDKLQGK